MTGVSCNPFGGSLQNFAALGGNDDFYMRPVTKFNTDCLPFSRPRLPAFPPCLIRWGIFPVRLQSWGVICA